MIEVMFDKCNHNCNHNAKQFIVNTGQNPYTIRYKNNSLPVHEIESTPGPWYSIMAPVPPATVRISATFRMTSSAVKCDIKDSSDRQAHTFW